MDERKDLHKRESNASVRSSQNVPKRRNSRGGGGEEGYWFTRKKRYWAVKRGEGKSKITLLKNNEGGRRARRPSVFIGVECTN